jgi:chemotaxis-related protein WspD
MSNFSFQPGSSLQPDMAKRPDASLQPSATTPVEPRDRLFDRPMPPGYREELRALESQSAARVAHRGGTILLFQLGELKLALPTRVAFAVAPVLHIARIPHRSGTVLLGVAAFRGEILPCCSLSRILDLPVTDLPASAEQTATAGRTLILEESPGRRWAIPIDGVLGVRPGANEYARLASPLAAQWTRGSVTEQSGVFHLLDHEVLFRQITLATA